MFLCFFLVRLSTEVNWRRNVVRNGSIEKTLFYSCRSSEKGGALFCGAPGVVLSVVESAFIMCYSESFGGGFAFTAGSNIAVKRSVAENCSVKFNGLKPWGSLGIFWCNGIIESMRVTECEMTPKSSICLHFRYGHNFIHCSNFSSNMNNDGYAALIYYDQATLGTITNSIFTNNTNYYFIVIVGGSGSLSVSNSLIVNNIYTATRGNCFTNCCIFNSTLPQSMISCITDRIIEVDDYKQCKLGLGSSEFTQQRNHDNLLILALYALALL